MNIAPIGKVCRSTDDQSVLEIERSVLDGLDGIVVGDCLLVLYWMHRLPSRSRTTLRVHPQGDKSRPVKGVFGLHSPMRPNPIGVTTVRVTGIEQNRVSVTGLDAMDGSPVIDIKGGAKPPAP